MISKRDDAVTTAGADVQPGGLVMGTDENHPPALPLPLDQVVPPPLEDTATRLARLARNTNTWEGARAALLRAMQLTREWERDHPHPHGE